MFKVTQLLRVKKLWRKIWNHFWVGCCIILKCQRCEVKHEYRYQRHTVYELTQIQFSLTLKAFLALKHRSVIQWFEASLLTADAPLPSYWHTLSSQSSNTSRNTTARLFHFHLIWHKQKWAWFLCWRQNIVSSDVFGSDFDAALWCNSSSLCRKFKL